MKINKVNINFKNILFAVLTVFIFNTALSAKGEPVYEDPYKGRNFVLKNQNGETLNMNELEGKVVFINFWATWCPPCIAEMPNINKLYEQYQDDEDVVFLMISLDKRFDTAKKFLKNKGFSFDIQEPQGSIPRDFKTRGIPITYVLGKDGKIEYTKIGMGNYNTNRFKAFLETLKEK